MLLVDRSAWTQHAAAIDKDNKRLTFNRRDPRDKISETWDSTRLAAWRPGAGRTLANTNSRHRKGPKGRMKKGEWRESRELFSRK